MAMIDAINLTKKQHRKIVVDNINISIFDNELFFIYGKKSSGKTDLLKMLSTVSSPNDGYVSINNIVNNENVKIGYIPQKMALSNNLSVLENIEFVLRINGYSVVDFKNSIDEILKEFSLYDRADDKAKTLSITLKRRLSIAMALIPNPDIIFVDEPTIGLQESEKKYFLNALQTLINKKTIVIATSSKNFVDELANRVAILSNGKLVELDTLSNLKEKYSCASFNEIAQQIEGE